MVALFGFGAGSDCKARKKTVTYGKLSRSTTKSQPDSGKNASYGSPSPSFGDHVSRKAEALQRSSSVKKVQKDEYDLSSGSEESRPNGTPSRANRMTDDFDVPSSDDNTLAKATSSARYIGRRLPTAEQTNRPLIAPGSRTDATWSKKRKRSERETSRPMNIKDATAKEAHERPIKITAPPVPKALQSPARQKPISTRTFLGSHDTKGQVSAPARLAAMVQEVPERRVIEAVSTPARRSLDSPSTVRRIASITPKQSQLWNDLLDDSVEYKRQPGTIQRVNASPSPSTSSHPRLQIETVDKQEPRPRLADRLKHYSRQFTRSRSSSDESQSSLSGASSSSMDEDQREAQEPSTQMDSQFTNLDSQATDTSTRSKNTYAYSRSYLQENLSFEESLLRPLVSDDIDNIERNSDSDDDPTQGIRTVHDLRAAGERKRFLDDVEAMLDDASDHSRAAWSKRRNALMDFFLKAIDADFRSKFLDSPFVLVIAKEFTATKPPDPIADSILLSILAILTKAPLKQKLVAVLCSPAIVRWAFQYVGDPRALANIVKDRNVNMSRVTQQSFLQFVEEVHKALFPEGQAPSVLRLEILSLQATSNALLCMHKIGQRQSILNGQELDKLGTFLRQNNSGSKDDEFRERLALIVLEIESLSRSANLAASSFSEQLIVDAISGFTFAVSDLSIDKERVLLYLRLLLNVTNDKSNNCDLFARHPKAIQVLLDGIVRGFSQAHNVNEVDEKGLDALLLSLGLAINLAEHSYAVRATVTPTAIQELTGLFVSGQERSSQAQSLEQSRINVAYGYLAVLLGNLSLNHTIKGQIVKKLPNMDIALLRHGVEEFIEYHRRVDTGEQIVEDEEIKEGAWAGFTARLGAIVDSLREE